MKMKTLYLVLAIVGALAPYFFFLRHFAAAGFDLFAFASAVFANPAASGFTVDLLISSLVFWIVMLERRRRGNGPHPGLFFVLNVTVGLSCALPAYLYANTQSAPRGTLE